MEPHACLNLFERFVFFVGALVIAGFSGGVGGLAGHLIIRRFLDE